jgi:hypothetical protein
VAVDGLQHADAVAVSIFKFVGDFTIPH